MRKKYLITLVPVALLTLFVVFRHHIRDLAEVSRTYSTFHSYIRTNPVTLIRYPPVHREQSSGLASKALSEPVPKIIHQIFLTAGRSDATLAKYEPAIQSCKTLHPKWAFNLWTDLNATQFMADFYTEIFPHYLNYYQNIQRANILRYALLHHYGGVYLDLDITCLVALDEPIIDEQNASTLTHLPWLTSAAYPAGVNNAFILSRPRHLFLDHILSHVPSRHLSWGMPYIENMLSTGCMFFSNMWTSYTFHMARQWKGAEGPMANRIYVLADEYGKMEPHMLRGKIRTPLFEHGGASSWHGWDAGLIILVGKYYHYFFCLIALGAGVGLFAAWRMFGWKVAARRRLSWWNLRASSWSQYSPDRDEECCQTKFG